MNVLRALVVVLALVTLASLPCVIAWLVVNADEMTERAKDARRRLPRIRPAVPMPIEETAAELRRLAAQLTLSTGSQARRAILRDQYDTALRSACQALSIQEHLAELDGIDLDIERVRVTGELQRAGLHIDASERERDAQDGRDRRDRQ